MITKVSRYKVRWNYSKLQSTMIVTKRDSTRRFNFTLPFTRLAYKSQYFLNEEVARRSEREESREKSTLKSPPDGLMTPRKRTFRKSNTSPTSMTFDIVIIIIMMYIFLVNFLSRLVFIFPFFGGMECMLMNLKKGKYKN